MIAGVLFYFFSHLFFFFVFFLSLFSCYSHTQHTTNAQPGIVNWEIMRGIETQEDLMHNAKYVLSVARKMGATVFIAWEDIVEVNKNMLVTFVCELMALDKGKHLKKKQ